MVDYLKKRQKREEMVAGPVKQDDRTNSKYHRAVVAVDDDAVPKAVGPRG